MNAINKWKKYFLYNEFEWHRRMRMDDDDDDVQITEQTSYPYPISMKHSKISNTFCPTIVGGAVNNLKSIETLLNVE
jgi:hypothetical protein